MSVTLAVRHLAAEAGRPGPVFVAGRLWLDAAGARLHDWDGEWSVLLADPVACDAVRSALPPRGEYLGGALLQAWVRDGPSGPELHDAYWVVLGDVEHEPPGRWGPRVEVRPVPPRHDFVR